MKLRRLWNLLRGRPPKSGYSLRGFWGQMRHFNKHGEQIGFTIKNFWGIRKRFDMEGNLKSFSIKNFWGGYNTYDANGNLIRRSRRNFWGGYKTYNREGKLTTESYRNFWEGFNHFNVERPEEGETYKYERWTEKAAVDEIDLVLAKQKSKQLSHEVFAQEKVDTTIPYYESIEKYVTEAGRQEPCAKILAFTLEDMTEIPAFVYEQNDKLEIVPLIRNRESVIIKKTEISEAKKEVLTGLDMSVMDKEFDSLGVSKLLKDFEELFPDYEYTLDGISRTQYVCKCGMVVTEKSWEELEKVSFLSRN